MNLVIVSHGLTLRVFLMRWYKWTVEQFEGLNNIGNGEMIVMEKGFGGRYEHFSLWLDSIRTKAWIIIIMPNSNSSLFKLVLNATKRSLIG